MNRTRALTDQGLMHPAGLEAFEKRKENRSGIYSYEQRTDAIPEPYAQKLRANKAAWDFFQAQVPSYRKAASWWVVSARRKRRDRNGSTSSSKTPRTGEPSTNTRVCKNRSNGFWRSSRKVAASARTSIVTSVYDFSINRC